jgi:hypothetical protein
MDTGLRTRLLEEYYAVDDDVLRLFLGHPLSSLRRSLDDIAESTRKEVKRCADWLLDVPVLSFRADTFDVVLVPQRGPPARERQACVRRCRGRV